MESYNPILEDGLLSSLKTNRGVDLETLSHQHPVLLVFLRHFGCLFCREALNDISKKKQTFKNKGVKVVFVHMADDDTANEYFEKYSLKEIDFVSDPECKYYEKFGLTKGSFSQLFGFQVMLRGFEASILNGNSFSLKQIGDGFQMPGVFLIQNGEIKDSYIHKRSSDRPNYEELIEVCEIE